MTTRIESLELRLSMIEIEVAKLTGLETELAGAREDIVELLTIFRTVKRGKGAVAWFFRTLIYLGGIAFALSAIWIFILWIKTGILPGTESSYKVRP